MRDKENGIKRGIKKLRGKKERKEYGNI